MSNDPNEAKSIFLHAADLPTAEERAAYVAQACEGKPELQARVERLLRTALQPDSLLDQPADELLATRISAGEIPAVSLDFLAPSPAPGSLGRLDGYEVLEVIGRGGMGVVLRAMDAKLNRVVAIKVLAPELAGNAQARKRFLREAQAAAAVSHDHVVTIHAVDDGTSEHRQPPFLVMECIAGQSLQQKIDKVGALSLKEILRIGMQIASGLAAAHKQGLVHRDIKPANILLENGVERVKITDFGLARATDDVGITVSGQIAGTPQYMSPEQAQGHPVDQRSDLFSLGSVLYTMCTGRPAFRADSAVAVLRRVCDDTPRPIGEVNAEVPDWLIAIVNRLMSKQPEDRYQTARDVSSVLEQALAHVQQPETAPRPVVAEISGNAQPEDEPESWLSAAVVSLLTLGFIAMVGLFAAEVSGAISSETRSLVMTYLIAALMGLLLVGRLIQNAFPWLSNSPETGPSAASASATAIEARSTNALPNGTLSRARHEWWSERDRWFTVSVQSLLVLAYLVCMVCFISFSASTGRDADGRSTFVYRLGTPTPWFKFEVYPEPLTPFRFGFHPFTWSVLIGLAGCLAYYVYYRIEKVRSPKMSRFDRPAYMLGCWGVGAVIAVVVGQVQGYAILNQPRMAVTPVSQDALIASGTITLPIPDGKSFDLWKEVAKRNGANSPPAAIAPFNADEAKAHQEAWAKHLGAPVEFTNSIGMKFRLIPPGEFFMGSTPDEMNEAYAVAGDDPIWKEHIRSEGPRHKVMLTKPVYLGVHEVTQAEYQRVMGGHASYFSPNGIGRASVAAINTDTLPVETVSWNDAAEFCAKLSEAEHRKPDYSRTEETVTEIEGNGYRLPTEAVWEFACRAGTTTKLWTGDDDEPLLNAAWFKTNAFNRTHPVGEMKANPFGLHDTHGNVWEWVHDRWDVGSYNQFQDQPAFDPTGPSVEAGSRHGLRGGDWVCTPSSCRSAHRHVDSATAKLGSVGFRVMLPIEAVKQTITPPAKANAPFDGEQAKQFQKDWSRHLTFDAEMKDEIGMAFSLIPPGQFLMGNSQDEHAALMDNLKQRGEGPFETFSASSAVPRHPVEITKPFYMGRYEITVAQFQRFVKETGYKSSMESQNDPRFTWKKFLPEGDSNQQPVCGVSWDDATAFCRWLSDKSKKSYSLPTEAQWEYACRAGSQTLWSFGNDEVLLNDHAHTSTTDTQRPQPVGQRKPNPFGLFDMHGNVDEWCLDWHKADYYHLSPTADPAHLNAPTDPASGRVARGGAWNSAPWWSRSTTRSYDFPTTPTHPKGFRVVINGDLSNAP